MSLLHEDVTEQIIGAAFEVHRVLGYGFLEKVYQNAMVVELELRGLRATSEPDLAVNYKGSCIGKYRGDLLVNDCVIVESKASKTYQREDEAQLLNELKATNLEVGLLINFGRSKVEFKRFVM